MLGGNVEIAADLKGWVKCRRSATHLVGGMGRECWFGLPQTEVWGWIMSSLRDLVDRNLEIQQGGAAMDRRVGRQQNMGKK